MVGMGFPRLAILLSLDLETRHNIDQGHLGSERWYSGWEWRCWARVTREMGRGLCPRIDGESHFSGPHAESVADMRDSGQRWVGLGIRQHLLAVHTWRSAAESCLFDFHNRNSQLLILDQELARETQAGYSGIEQLQERLHNQGCGENKH